MKENTKKIILSFVLCTSLVRLSLLTPCHFSHFIRFILTILNFWNHIYAVHVCASVCVRACVWYTLKHISNILIRFMWVTKKTTTKNASAVTSGFRITILYSILLPMLPPEGLIHKRWEQNKALCLVVFNSNYSILLVFFFISVLCGLLVLHFFFKYQIDHIPSLFY